MFQAGLIGELQTGNDSTFLVITNYTSAAVPRQIDVDYHLQLIYNYNEYDDDDDDDYSLQSTLSTANAAAATELHTRDFSLRPKFREVGIDTIIITIIAVVAILFIAGHVLVVCRKRTRRQTWSVQSTASGARGRFVQHDVWKSRLKSITSSGRQSAASGDPFQSDIYRTLAYAYINWKQDVTSLYAGGTCSRTGSTVSSLAAGHMTVSAACIPATESSKSLSSSSSRTDDVTLPSSVTSEVSLMTSPTPLRTSDAKRTCSDTTCHSITADSSSEQMHTKKAKRSGGRRISSKSSSIVELANSDEDYELTTRCVLGSDAVIDLDGTTNTTDVTSDVSVTSLSCSPV